VVSGGESVEYCVNWGDVPFAEGEDVNEVFVFVNVFFIGIFTEEFADNFIFNGIFFRTFGDCCLIRSS
jgi:hypothetical protein